MLVIIKKLSAYFFRYFLLGVFSFLLIGCAGLLDFDSNKEENEAKKAALRKKQELEYERLKRLQKLHDKGGTGW